MLEENHLDKTSYIQTDVNEAIEIYEGDCLIEVGESQFNGTCKITISWHPNLIIRFATNSPFISVDARQEAFLTLSDWGHKTIAYIDSINYSLTDSGGNTKLLGKLAQQGFLFSNQDNSVQSIIFHIINLNNISFYELNSEDEYSEVDSLNLACNDWSLKLSKYNEDKKIYDKLEHFNGYAITHLISIERLTPYSGKVEAYVDEISDFLTSFLSFHRGLRISACLPIGVNADNAIVFRVLQGKSIDFWQTVPEHTYTTSSRDLQHSVVEFWNKWQNSDWHDALKMIIHWYIESNTLSGGLQGAIVQQQAAFERFAWTLKENGLAFIGISDAKFNNIPAAEKILETLEWGQIQESVPPYNKNIIDYFEQKQKIISGPDLLVEIRNGLVHPKPSRREMLNDVSPSMMFEIHRLGQSYLKQLIGKIVDMPEMSIIFPEYELKNKP